MVNFSVAKNSPVPIYQQIKRSLMQVIENGALKHGDPIPSENELASRYKISRMTARKATEELVREGRLMRVPGKGTFVGKRKNLVELAGLRSFTEEALRLGYVPGSRILRQEIVNPSRQVTENLKLTEGEKAVMIERIRTLDGQPVSLGTSYFPATLCSVLRARDLTNQSIYRVLEGELGFKLGWARETIGCCSAPKKVTKLLGIKPTTAVLSWETLVFLDDGTPIEYHTAYTWTHQYRLMFELKR
jgi:GntR family transcriptional regulator